MLFFSSQLDSRSSYRALVKRNYCHDRRQHFGRIWSESEFSYYEGGPVMSLSNNMLITGPWYIRVVRLVKVLKLLRVVRMMRSFRELSPDSLLMGC